MSIQTLCNKVNAILSPLNKNVQYISATEAKDYLYITKPDIYHSAHTTSSEIPIEDYDRCMIISKDDAVSVMVSVLNYPHDEKLEKALHAHGLEIANVINKKYGNTFIVFDPAKAIPNAKDFLIKKHAKKYNNYVKHKAAEKVGKGFLFPTLKKECESLGIIAEDHGNNKSLYITDDKFTEILNGYIDSVKEVLEKKYNIKIKPNLRYVHLTRPLARFKWLIVNDNKGE